MAHTPDTIKVDILMRAHGGDQVHHLATVDLPVQIVHTGLGPVRAYDPSPIGDAGKAIAEALRKLSDEPA
ncbi:hypothetical protein ACFWPK_04395 [Nocardia sp. NPDC058519]|uniref:hypothetical protein n=1 Tax=Nocardia sp. NPDC058519 TaxID=3346535 RepID=UPI003661D7AF